MYYTFYQMHTVFPSYSPTVARECLHIKCTIGLYEGNPNDLDSVDELKYFVDRTKRTVSPAYSPTVASECLHIKCTIGRMQRIRMICILFLLLPRSCSSSPPHGGYL